MWVEGEEMLAWQVLIRLLCGEPNTWNICQKFWQTIQDAVWKKQVHVCLSCSVVLAIAAN